MTFCFRKVKHVSLTYIIKNITITAEFNIWSDKKYFSSIMISILNFSLSHKRRVMNTQQNTGFLINFNPKEKILKEIFKVNTYSDIKYQ